MAGIGLFGGALTASQAADLSSINASASSGAWACTIGTTTFFAVPDFQPKDVALQLGAGIRATIIVLHACILDVPPMPIRAQTPITVQPAGEAPTAMVVKEAWRESEGSLVRIVCELAA